MNLAARGANAGLVYTFRTLTSPQRTSLARPSWRPLLVAVLLAAFPGRATAQDGQLKSTAPMPVSPPHATVLDGLPASVPLTALNAEPNFVPAVFNHRFEVYDVTNGLTLVVSALVAAGSDSSAYSFAGPLAYSTVYQWRVRGELEGAGGPWSATWSFETTDPPPPPPPPAGPLGFTDITIVSGLDGPPAIPLGGHGAAFADATGDGQPDLYVTTNFNDPVADQFFVNQGGGGFREEGPARGIADFDAGSHGGVFGDLDNDGDFDFFNGATGTGLPNHVYRNNGSGTFTNVTPPSILGRSEATRGALAFDMDRDGDLDLFGVSGWMGSGDPPGERNELYRNDGGFQFTSVTSGAAYTAPAGQGATDTDFDGDSDIDLLAGNRDGDMIILRNDGAGGFTLVDPTGIGIEHRAYSGITMGDIDNDGDLDMAIVGLDAAGETVGHLYRNVGAGTFTHLRDFTGIDGYMAAFADLDHDGDVDLAFAGDDLIYLNGGSGTFSAGPSVPVGGIDDPRAIAVADIDDDGDPDLAVGVKRSRNWLLQNDLNGGNWLKIELISPHGQSGAFGAKVSVYDAMAAGTPPLAIRESRSNNGYLGQDDPVLHVGLGDHTLVNVIVTFLNGITRVLAGVAANQTVMIDGSGRGSAPVYVEQHRGRTR